MENYHNNGHQGSPEHVQRDESNHSEKDDTSSDVSSLDEDDSYYEVDYVSDFEEYIDDDIIVDSSDEVWEEMEDEFIISMLLFDELEDELLGMNREN